MQVDGDQELQFSQVFVLAKEGESFYVYVHQPGAETSA
jgi:hypothetical protein